MSKGLSKSKYTTFRKCPKCLWLGAYKPEEQVIDASTQARFTAGNEVGDLRDGEGVGETEEVGKVIRVAACTYSKTCY